MLLTLLKVHRNVYTMLSLFFEIFIILTLLENTKEVLFLELLLTAVALLNTHGIFYTPLTECRISAMSLNSSHVLNTALLFCISFINCFYRAELQFLQSLLPTCCLQLGLIILSQWIFMHHKYRYNDLLVILILFFSH